MSETTPGVSHVDPDSVKWKKIDTNPKIHTRFQ